MKTSQGSQLAYKSPSFHSEPYLLWALLSHLGHPSALQSVWQDFNFLQVSEMIQYKWFIIGSHVFSELFLRISFGQPHYTLKFNLREGIFFPFYFLCLNTASAFERCLLVSNRFLNSAIKPSLPLTNKKWQEQKKLEYGIFDIWHVFYPSSNMQSFTSCFTTCELRFPKKTSSLIFI